MQIKTITVVHKMCWSPGLTFITHNCGFFTLVWVHCCQLKTKLIFIKMDEIKINAYLDQTG